MWSQKFHPVLVQGNHYVKYRVTDVAFFGLLDFTARFFFSTKGVQDMDALWLPP